MAAEPGQRAAVRSFVVRAGRVTPSQRRAIEGCGPRFLLDPARPLEPASVFGREAPLGMEIGFGNGEALLELARRHPERDYLGVEVYPSGIGRLLARLDAEGLANVRVYRADTVEVLHGAIRPGQLAAVYLWFPDPWPKKRHHKRRLVQPGFLERLAECLAPAGLLHMATDWEDYARHMREVADAEPRLRNLHPQTGFAPDPGERPATRLQRRGDSLGHGVWDLCYRRVRGGRG
jgi:tRNA (guanine-N7-)-methyltransferase